jgi:hypothetical protein
VFDRELKTLFYVGSGLALLLCLLLTASTAPATASSDDEIQVKFISKLVIFVEWPEGAFETEEEPIVVGVLGGNPYGAALDSILGSAQARGRSFEIKHLTDVSQAESVHVLLLGERSKSALRSLASALRGVGVVSIAQSWSYAENGGTIGIEMHKGKVAFEVNNRTAKRSGLKLSSRLLQIATTVY